MRIEKAKERIFLTEEETAILQRTDKILYDMYNKTQNDRLILLLEDIMNYLGTLWGETNDFEIFPTTVIAPKIVKINIELH